MGATSSDRGLIVPTNFGDVGIWGPELVTTLTALDTILGGSLTLQSSAGMSVTLSSSQAQYGRIVVQGQLASTFFLTFGSFANGDYQVWNNSSAGGGGVLCQAAGGGSNCTVPFNSMRLVNVDGVNAQLADVQPLQGLQSGYLNKFYNGTFAVAQRGTSGQVALGGVGAPTLITQLSLDGWYVGGTRTGQGPSTFASWSQVYSANFNGYGIRITNPISSGLSYTAALFQRIESSVAAQLLGSNISSPQAVTVQFIIYNNSGSSVTPTLTTSYANSRDNWGASTTDVGPVNLQTCPNGATTNVAYTFTPSANAANGYQILLTLGVLAPSGGSPHGGGTPVTYFDVGIADIRATPGLPIGLNSAPPTPEQRPIHDELEFCQRYLFVPPSGWSYMKLVNIYNTGQMHFSTSGEASLFPVPMRAAPTASNLTFSTTSVASVSQPATQQTNVGWGFDVLANVGIVVAEFYVTGGLFSAEL